jgi:phosphomevalonate kinase
VTSTYASAPGKLVLCGEYVVLDGAPALGLALDSRASVIISTTADRSGSHVVQSPGFADQPYSFQVADDSGFEWPHGVAADFGLLQCVWQSLEFRPSTGLHLTLDTEALVDAGSGDKLGIGSSAALVVALSAAIASQQGREVDLDTMIAIHRLFQNGRGSGIDVATARIGGVVEYHFGSQSTTRRRQWPSDLQYAILWSGAPASTESKLSILDSAESGGSSRERLAVASEKIVGSWSRLEAKDIVSLFVEYVTLLRDFSVNHDLGVFDAGHDELVIEAMRHGVAYKPCGAGGGDIGIALSASQGALNEFVTAATNTGFRLCDFRIDEIGLLIDDQST